jgi:predicted dehydrogenase
MEPIISQIKEAKMNKIYLILFGFIVGGCSNSIEENNTLGKIKIITVDPGHFHSALVQKSMYDDVDSTVHVYAPDGDELKAHLNLIQQYNNDLENPTSWNEVIYTGNDFFEKMLEEKAGNVVMLAGNNQKKTDYIQRSINGGFNVLADKPMAIDKASFEVLKETFDSAKEKDLLLYDIMTERYEITTMLQREFSLIPEVFGIQEKGTPENPAVTKESVHHFYKYVSGNVLTRPAWFFDVEQEGEGIVDVTTHLVDLIQWECFPNQIIDYKKDIELVAAKRWSTDLTLDQFYAITKLQSLPSYLNKDLNNNVLKVFSNGEINYRLKGIHAKVSVKWAYQAPEGTGDTHYSIMRGSKANLVIEQGVEQGYKPALYIEPINGKEEAFKLILVEKIKELQQRYPGIDLKEAKNGWEVLIPEKYKEGHEAHFARVTEKFLEYMKNGNMPDWEVPNMISKYYTTTAALELAKKTK